MVVDSGLVSSLELLLKREVQLYGEYLKVLKDERSVVTKFNSEKLIMLTEKRDHLAVALLECQEKRLGLMRRFPEWRGLRLTQLIERFCSPADQAKLLPLAAKLRSAIQEAQKQTREFSGIVEFANRMVGGLVSLFWSGSLHKNTAYSRSGEVRETLQPGGNRRSNVLKSA